MKVKIRNETINIYIYNGQYEYGSIMQTLIKMFFVSFIGLHIVMLNKQHMFILPPNFKIRLKNSPTNIAKLSRIKIDYEKALYVISAAEGRDLCVPDS